MSIELPRSRPRLGLLIFLARRSLLGSRITFVLLVLAIAAGAGFQIPNAANLEGFADALLEDGLTHGAGDIRVESRDRPRFADGEAEVAKIVAAVGVSGRPILVYGGAVGLRGRFLGTPVYGIDFATKPYPFHVVSGAVPAPGDTAGLLIGSSLANRLGVKVGDLIDLRVIFGAADAVLEEDNMGRFEMTVRGTVAGSAGGYRFAFVDRAFVAKQAGEPRAASAIVVHLADHDDATAVAARINASHAELQAVGWREDDPFLTNYLTANRTINTISYAMVIAAVSIPMWALLYIRVLTRRREIGILAALGFGRREIFVMYVLQSAVVGLLGCLIGVGLGWLLIRYFQSNPIFDWESLVVRPVFALTTVLVPTGVIMLTALIAGSHPAWRAARTDPAKVLRRIE